MTNINDHIAHFLDYYITLPDPRYAVMLTGTWGCGKTHYIKQWKEKIEQRIKEDKGSTISKPIYVSLFGLTSIKEVNDAITKEIYPIMKSRIYHIGKQALSVITKVAIKCDLTDSEGDKTSNINVDLDIVSLFRSESKTGKVNSIIIFDDFERCKVDSVDMLGYINQFVEHSNVRSIIICHETEVSNKAAYDKFKEKLVGRTFEIKPDTMCAISEFCNTPGVFPFDERRQRMIKEIFEKVGYNNLRPLYQCLQDFSSVLMALEVDEEDDHQKEILDKLLIQYIVAYCEYASNEIFREVSAANHPFGYVNPADFLDVSSKNNELESKYIDFAGFSPAHWMFQKPFASILKSIHTGEDVTDVIKNHFWGKKDEMPLFRRISSYFLLENEEFNQTYGEALQYIKNPTSSIDTVISILSYIIIFDKNGIRKMEAGTIETVKKNVRNIISNFDSFEEFSQYKKLHLDGILQELKYNVDVDQGLKELGTYIETVAKDKYQDLEGDEKSKLTLLNNDNFNDVISLFFQQEETGIEEAPKYGNAPFFDYIDPSLFVDSLSKLNNENKVRFYNFMKNRTKKINPKTGQFHVECENLLKISAELKDLTKSKVLVEKFTLEKLSQAFAAAADKSKKY